MVVFTFCEETGEVDECYKRLGQFFPLETDSSWPLFKKMLHRKRDQCLFILGYKKHEEASHDVITLACAAGDDNLQVNANRKCVKEMS